MKTVKLEYRSRLTVEVTEGESIEKKIERMVDSQEPIGETAPIVYTKKRTELYLHTIFAQTNGI